MTTGVGSRSGPDFASACAYALERLEQDLPATLYYHSIWHTRDEVVPRTAWLLRQEGVSDAGVLLALTAAYYHDLGFVIERRDHETTSAQMAAQVLPHFGYGIGEIRIIQSIILATKLPQAPLGLLAQVVADADLDVLGRDDFMPRNYALRAELAVGGYHVSDQTWYTDQARFLQQHRYFTATAQRERDRMKQENLAELRRLIADAPTAPASVYTAAALPPTTFALT